MPGINVFTYTDADLSLDEVTEAQLIRVAQGHAATLGKADPEAAKNRLIEAYGPALRAAVSRFKGGVGDGQLSNAASDYGTSSRSMEDLQSAALVGILEAIATHDPSRGPRLAGHLVQHLNRALSEETVGAPAFAIPTRTLSRFYGILKAAEGDLILAAESAPEYGMSREVFGDVLAAVDARSLDEGSGIEEEGRVSGDYIGKVVASPVFAASPVVDVEDKILVDMAFAAMSDEEARICELAYGFTEYDPVPDPEIAHRLDTSKATVQRKRNKALAKSRLALGVALVAEVA